MWSPSGDLLCEAIIVRDDVVTDFDTLIADEDGGTGDELTDVVLIFVAERTTQDFALGRSFSTSSVSRSAHVMRVRE